MKTANDGQKSFVPMMNLDELSQSTINFKIQLRNSISFSFGSNTLIIFDVFQQEAKEDEKN
jgi:hypothetical protein